MARTSMRALNAAGSAWVSRYRELVDRAVLQFQATGQWPRIREFQRQLDRHGLKYDVVAAAHAMPSLASGTGAALSQELAIPLWLLRFVSTAQPLTQMALVIIKRAVALYLSPDVNPHVRSDDPVIRQQASWPQLVLRAGDLIRACPPNPFACGTTSEGSWDYIIDEGFTSRLRDVDTLDDYVTCQVEWLKEASDKDAEPPAAAFDAKDSQSRNTRSNESRLTWLTVVVTGAFVLVGAALSPVIANWISHDDSGATAHHGSVTPSATGQGSMPAASVAGVPVDPRVSLTQANFCSWRFATHPMPLVSARPVRVRIDDRCNFPKDPNPATDSPTGVYSIAAQSPGVQIGNVRDGQLVTIRCYLLGGETVADAVGNVSRIWLGLVSPRGVIPDVDVGGGYSQAQLEKLGLTSCPG